MGGRVTWHGAQNIVLNKTLVAQVNCRPTGRFLAILNAIFPLNLCSRLHFFETKHTTRTHLTCESSHLDFNCGSARGGSIEYYSTTSIKLAMLCYSIDSSKRCVCPLYKFVYSFKVESWKVLFVTPCSTCSSSYQYAVPSQRST
jgi:hypothetical protein